MQAGVKMFELNQIVIPRVMVHWKDLAYSMRYSIGDVQAFNKDGRDVRECCQELFTNWLTTAHGPTPKSYQTLQQRYDHFTLHFIFLLQLYWKSKQYTYVILCYHALGY